MTSVVQVLGVSHNPFHHRLARSPADTWPPGVADMEERGAMMAQRLRDARADALVVVGNDHFHQFFMDNMPAFIIGKMELYDGTFYNEVREFDLPPCQVPGDKALSEQILAGAMEREVDFAYSDELKLDHSVIVPLLFVRPALDLPIVPIMTNCVHPPMPTAARFYNVGRVLRAVIDSLPGNKRVAVVVSGHLSLEVGGPRHFQPHPPDPEFDDRLVDYIRRGDFEPALRECTFERLLEAGNVSHQFLNYLLGAGVADGVLPSYVDCIKRPGNSQAWFAWDLEGVAA